MNNQKLKLEEYTEDEIKEILNNNERLVIINAGEEVIAKYDDIPDIIVDLNDKLGSVDLEIYNYSEPSMTPMITTFGYFLNKCEQNVRRDIIDRLVQLQTEEIEVKPYKVIDVDLIDEIKGSLENNDEMER